MANPKSKVINPVTGKLCDHFVIKVDDNNKIIDDEKAHCFHWESLRLLRLEYIDDVFSNSYTSGKL